MPRGDTQKKVPDDVFADLFQEHGAAETARQTGMSLRRVYARRREVEAKLGSRICGPKSHIKSVPCPAPGRLHTKVYDGRVMVGSDHHFWPGRISTAHRAFCKLAKKLRPKVVIANGDVLDLGQISRHPPIGWENQPSVEEEILTAQARLEEQERAAPNAERFWPLGNHDARFETKIATVAPEYAKVHGVHLQDHFSGGWQPCWSVWINDDVVVKHRFKGGIHATHNNAIWSGKTMVTGHLHSQKVTPFTDYNGTRWGVDCGTMADPYGDQFAYIEDGPRNWRSGFAVLTFVKGQLLTPELCRVVEEGVVDWRGDLIEV